MGRCQFGLQPSVFKSGLRMGNQVVAEEQAVPMQGVVASNHVNVVRARAVPVAADEKGIPRRNVVTEGRAPEVVVALSFQNRRNLEAGSSEGAYLHQEVG